MRASTSESRSSARRSSAPRSTPRRVRPPSTGGSTTPSLSVRTNWTTLYRHRRAHLRRSPGPVGSCHPARIAAGNGRAVHGRVGAADVGAVEPPLVGEVLWRAVEKGAEQVGRPGARRTVELLVEGAGVA